MDAEWAPFRISALRTRYTTRGSAMLPVAERDSTVWVLCAGAPVPRVMMTTVPPAIVAVLSSSMAKGESAFDRSTETGEQGFVMPTLFDPFSVVSRVFYSSFFSS